MGNTGFSVSIGGQDSGAARTIDNINKRIQALTAPADRLNKQFSKLADNTGISALSRGMGDLSRTSLSAFENMGRMSGVLSSLTSAGAIAGVGKLIGSWAEAGQKLQFAGARAGLGAQQLNSIEKAGRLAGVAAGVTSTAMKALGDNITDAAAGRAPEAAMAFDFLHVSMRGLNGRLLTSAEMLPKVAAELSKIENPTLRARLATTLFGGAAEEMLPFLSRGAKGVEELTKRADSYGIITDKSARKAAEFEGSLEKVRQAIGGVTDALGEKWSDRAKPWLDSLSELVKENHDLFVSIGDVGTAIVALGALKPAAWVLRLLGLGGVVTAATAAATIGLPLALSGDTPSWTAMVNRPDPEVDALPKSFLGQGGTLENWIRDRASGLSSRLGFTGSNDITTAEQQKNIDQIRGFYQDKGLADHRIAGILSSAKRESNFNPGAIGDGGTSGGVFQWHNERLQALKLFAGESDVRKIPLKKQLEFQWWEMTQGPEQRTMRLLNKTENEGQSAATFSQAYERPAGGEGEAMLRAGLAPQYLAAPANIQNGSGTPAGAGSVTVNGNIGVNIKGPPGTTAMTSGDAFANSGAPRIGQAMPGFGE